MRLNKEMLWEYWEVEEIDLRRLFQIPVKL